MMPVEDERIDEIDWTTAPVDRPTTTLDVRGLGPPEPLQRTLQTLTDLQTTTVLLQLNDRPPQHLYPQLDERGYRCETVETDDLVVTAIWDPQP